MPEQTTPSAKEQQKMLEEQRQKFEAAKAQMERTAAKTREGWVTRIQNLRSGIEETQAFQQQVDAARAKVEPHKDTPEGFDYFGRMVLLTLVNTSLIMMKEREIACYEACIALTDAIGPLDTDPPPAVPVFPKVSDDLAYLEAQARFHVATLAYHWMRNREGLEVVLRASGNRPVLAGDEEFEAPRRASVDAIKALAAKDKDLTILLGKLGAELDEARALLEWSQASLQTVPQLPDGPKRQALNDPDWAKVNGAAQLVIALPTRVSAYAQLAALFSPAEPTP